MRKIEVERLTLGRQLEVTPLSLNMCKVKVINKIAVQPLKFKAPLLNFLYVRTSTPYAKILKALG